MRSLTRRDFLASGVVTLGAFVAGPGLWRRALADHEDGHGPYGPLQEPDANGVMLPPGFESRIVARSGELVAGTAYVWHVFPDGGACFASGDGGWVYVSNSEVPVVGGVGAIRFDASGAIVDGYRVLVGTSQNCAGGATPWGTWLSGEEHDRGQIWECNPFGQETAVPRPAMGVFTHEAAAVDPVHGHVYLTEDRSDGRFYRFVPETYPNLSAGVLQVARVNEDGSVVWHDVPDPAGLPAPTRLQVAGSTAFSGGEGCAYDDGTVYFTTKGDNRVWAYDTEAASLSVIYDDSTYPGAPLSGVDNVVVSGRSGDVFVAEDGADRDIVILTPEGLATRLLKVVGPDHVGSELAGPAFNPAGDRFYFSSQRGGRIGITFEVTGPFRTTR